MASFFLGIGLPRELAAECEAWRRLFQAPRTKAHITLIPPFMWEEKKGDLKAILEESTGALKPFTITGAGLGSFGRRVIFINVQPTTQLARLRSKLAESLKAHGIPKEGRRYKPHITLASRLNRAEFDRFQKELENYRPAYSFECSEITVFEFSAAGSWEEKCRIPLGSQKKKGAEL
ncbi:MAG TPA: 2'-5' RNA ligase family protein [Firmicutes bacterium]|nr:2'-5' RNA ligase family protein [Bacillota bacterium]